MLRFSVAALVLGAAGFAVANDGISPGGWPVDAAEAAGHPYDVPYGGHLPGGYEGRVGSPYYWSIPGGTVPFSTGGTGGVSNVGGGYYVGGYHGGGIAPGGKPGCNCNKGAAARYSGGYAGPVVAPTPDPISGGYAGSAVVPTPDPISGGQAIAQAGPSAAPSGGPGGDPYSYHFGPGFYRSGEFNHYRFPYYSYRRPWYDVGHPVRVRDTNLPW